jgi:hypothetical protein
VYAGGFDRAGGDLHRWPAQHIEHMGGIEAADAIALGTLAIVISRLRAGTAFHRSSSHLRPEIVFKLEHPLESRAKVTRACGWLHAADASCSIASNKKRLKYKLSGGRR